jgi:hypothetical protein
MTASTCLKLPNWLSAAAQPGGTSPVLLQLGDHALHSPVSYTFTMMGRSKQCNDHPSMIRQLLYNQARILGGMAPPMLAKHV